MANLFTSQTPAITDASDGTPGITLGTTQTFSASGTVSGVWFYATATVGGSYSVGFWTVDSSDPGGGTQLAGKVLGATPTAGTWNLVTFDTPVSVSTGITYRATVFSGDGRYVATTGFFTSAGLTNGSATAPQHSTTVNGVTISQGTFRINASVGYPNTSGNGTCYFVAADYAASGGAASPDGLAVPVGLGAPTVNAGAAASVTPNGLAVPVGLGAPSVNAGQAGTAAPNGLAVPVGLGAPSVGLAPSAPNGLAVSVSLGAPTVSAGQAGAVSPNSLAVPVSLGAPSIIFSASPSGISIPVELGAPEVGQATGSGGWHDFGGIIQGAINDAALNAERRRNPIDCPEHGWPLKITTRGRHCQFGGHVVTGSF